MDFLSEINMKDGWMDNDDITQLPYRRRLHGGVAIAPTAKMLWGRRPKVAPTGIVLSQVFFETVK